MKNHSTSFCISHEINLDTAGIIFTTYCNMRCSECCLHIPKVDYPEHYGIHYIEHAASYLFGIKTIGISGGEPTLHPEFPQIVPMLKNLFGCQTLAIATNGYNAIEYSNVLHHFDLIRLSYYITNSKETEFLRQNFMEFLDAMPSGPALHVCTARRARRPIPCARAGIVLYCYGRLYPCCTIPSGWEGIGIPLTKTWREDILKIPLPCADCFFAEEGDSSIPRVRAIHSPPINSMVDTEMPDEVRPSWRWPHPRDDIKIYGLDLDSWMGWEADIKINPRKGTIGLVLCFESHAPEKLHPIILTFIDEHGNKFHTHIVKNPGASVIQIELRSCLNHPGESIITMLCNKTFIPSQLNPQNPDSRELGIRIRSIHFK